MIRTPVQTGYHSKEKTHSSHTRPAEIVPLADMFQFILIIIGHICFLDIKLGQNVPGIGFVERGDGGDRGHFRRQQEHHGGQTQAGEV